MRFRFVDRPFSPGFFAARRAFRRACFTLWDWAMLFRTSICGDGARSADLSAGSEEDSVDGEWGGVGSGCFGSSACAEEGRRSCFRKSRRKKCPKIDMMHSRQKAAPGLEGRYRWSSPPSSPPTSMLRAAVTSGWFSSKSITRSRSKIFSSVGGSISIWTFRARYSKTMERA